MTIEIVDEFQHFWAVFGATAIYPLTSANQLWADSTKPVSAKVYRLTVRVQVIEAALSTIGFRLLRVPDDFFCLR